MRRYFALARLPRGRRLLVGSLLVAPGQAALDLVILLAMHRATGSFGPGGVAVAAGTIGFSITTVAQGHVIDRIGIRRVLLPTAAVSILATAGLAAALALDAAPVILIGLCATVGLATPATGPAVRTAWTAVAPDVDTRTTAFSYCSLTQDVGFVAGPAVFGLLATATTPVISLACCGALVASGAIAIASTSTATMRGDDAPSGQARDVLRRLAPVATVMAAIGITLGAVDVSAPAFASQHGHAGLAGVLVAASSLGSVFGGLIYGTRSWRASLTRRLLAFTAAAAVLLVLPAVAPTPAAAAVALLIAGAPLGATLTTAYLLAGELVPTERTTVGFAFLSLTLNAGAAAGYAVAAQIAARGSAASGFLLGAGGSVIAAFATASLMRRALPTHVSR